MLISEISSIYSNELDEIKSLTKYPDVNQLNASKEAFYKRITRKRLLTSKKKTYVGGFILSKKDLMKILTPETCEGVLVSFGFEEIGCETHLIIRRIVRESMQTKDENGFSVQLKLEEDCIFSTNPNGGNSPDPVLHCPGPNCNP